MGRTYERIDDSLREWIQRQAVFFVATAPLDPNGHVNLSPKGLQDTLAVLDDRRVAYLDLAGSGVETIAHLRENGRITLMLCSFVGSPRILRLSGRGEAVLPDDARFGELASRFPTLPGVRSVIVVDLDRVADSCGWGVPRMDLRDHRDLLPRTYAEKGPGWVADYKQKVNRYSVDGLPALD